MFPYSVLGCMLDKFVGKAVVFVVLGIMLIPVVFTGMLFIDWSNSYSEVDDGEGVLLNEDDVIDSGDLLEFEERVGAEEKNYWDDERVVVIDELNDDVSESVFMSLREEQDIFLEEENGLDVSDSVSDGDSVLVTGEHVEHAYVYEYNSENYELTSHGHMKSIFRTLLFFASLILSVVGVVYGWKCFE